MVDLNDIAVFEKVAAFSSFSVAARTLGLPKSSVSRAIGRLEADLGARLFQRNTRRVQLTAVGEALRERIGGGLATLEAAIELAASMASAPRGTLRISAGIGFGINVLGEQLPGFLGRHPEVRASIELASREADLVAEGVDIAVRMGTLVDSTLVATRLGSMNRYLCAAPSYLERRGRPAAPGDLAGHDTIEMPDRNGRVRPWPFRRDEATTVVEVAPRVSVNDALVIARLVRQGVGIGIISGYLCADGLRDGSLVHLLPEWCPPPVEVSLVFPSRREMSPAVRAFVDYMREMSTTDVFWTRSAD